MYKLAESGIIILKTLSLANFKRKKSRVVESKFYNTQQAEKLLLVVRQLTKCSENVHKLFL